MKSAPALQVAVGVLTDPQGNVLITRRAKQAHQGGLWEFPGGKLEAGENVLQALYRELQEEIGIQVSVATPLIRIWHDYGDRQVLLDVWRVREYTGKVTACEAQAMRWLTAHRLNGYAFPAANLPIIKAVQLPEYYAILEGRSIAEVLDNCRRILQHGVKLVQFRAKSLPVADLQAAYTAVLQYCREHQAQLLLNADLPLSPSPADGLHLSSRALMACVSRPNGFGWLAASCHNLAELKHAVKLGVDFVVLAPVQVTASHPGQQPLGWQNFTELTEQVNLPVFALGGLALADLRTAQQAGAQGLAGISAFC